MVALKLLLKILKINIFKITILKAYTLQFALYIRIDALQHKKFAKTFKK